MKKIIIAVPYLNGTGGTETVISNFYDAVVNESKDNRVNWKLISFGGSKEYKWMNNWRRTVYHFSDIRIIQLFCYIFVMPFLIRKNILLENPDYFIATNPIIWTLAFNICHKRKLDTKIIAWYHYSYIKKNVKRFYLKKADIFWAISTGIKKELLKLGVNEKKIFVVYNPINIKTTNTISRSKLRNRYIYIGRIDYDSQKNVSELFRALKELSFDWNLDLYGSVSDKDKKQLLNILSKNDRTFVNFHGFSNNVWKSISTADVLILTSKYEGLPMVLCEAASNGIPLISSDCKTGTGDIVNRNNGWLYHAGNYKQLATLLTEINDGAVEIPDVKHVKESVNKFNYKNYSKRIFETLEV